MILSVTRFSAHIALLVLLAGFLGATLVRLGPGFAVDERELDVRYSAGTRAAIRAEAARNSSLPRFYWHYLTGLAKGDLGESRAWNRPVRELLRERAPVTLRTLAVALPLGWALALGLALGGSVFRSRRVELGVSIFAGFFLCIPMVLVALLFLYVLGPVEVALAFIVFPRIYRYCRNVLEQAGEMPHVLLAHGKGLGTARVLVFHVLPAAAPELISLAGVTLTIAFTALIPLEAICDSPGIGQLAWQSALARDLPVLVNMTLLLAVATIMVNAAADAVRRSREVAPA